MMGKQSIIVRMEETLARKARRFLEEPDAGYASLDELVEVALRNQLALDMVDELRSDAPGAASTRSADSLEETDRAAMPLLDQPDLEPDNLAETPEVVPGRLFLLTNRLGPTKVACRVLSRMRDERQEWPPLEVFQDLAADAARALGGQLQAEDREEGRAGRAKRSVGFPTGKSEEKAKRRFVSSFTITEAKEGAEGPMAVFGLATLHDDRVLLTGAGWELAVAPSPLVDGEGDKALSAVESELFRERLCHAPDELEAVQGFLDAVAAAQGRQGDVDEILLDRRQDWSPSKVASHRAALLGRLTDMEVVAVDGRGDDAQIEVLPPAETILDQPTHPGGQR